MTTLRLLFITLFLITLAKAEIKPGVYFLELKPDKANSATRVKGLITGTKEKFTFTFDERGTGADGRKPEQAKLNGKTKGDKITFLASIKKEGKHTIPYLEGTLSKDKETTAGGVFTIFEEPKEELKGKWVLLSEAQLAARNKKLEADPLADAKDVPAGFEGLKLTAPQAKKIKQWLEKNMKSDPQDLFQYLETVLSDDQLALLLKNSGQ